MKADLLYASGVLLATTSVSLIRTSGGTWQTPKDGTIVIPTGHRVVLEVSEAGVFRAWREPAGEEK